MGEVLGASWTPDNKGFFYSRFPEPTKDAAFQSLNVNMKLYYHRLGTPQSDDVLVYQRPDQPKWGINGTVTEDGRYLVINVSDGTTSRKARIVYKDLLEPLGLPLDLVADHDNKFFFIGNDGPVFFFRTDYRAKKNQIIAIDTRKPEKKEWKSIVPEAKDDARKRRSGRQRLHLYLPEGCEITGQGLRDDGQTHSRSGAARHRHRDWLQRQAERYRNLLHLLQLRDAAECLSLRHPDRREQALAASEGEVRSLRYEVKQVFYASKDGTKIPMFIAYKKGIQLDGNNPTLLYGYGGFNISLTPGFSVSRLQWMEMGGVFALANLRGGGEYGDAWHRAGTKLEEAKRLRRLHRRRGVPDQGEVHQPQQAGDPGRQQWRAAGWRGA